EAEHAIERGRPDRQPPDPDGDRQGHGDTNEQDGGMHDHHRVHLRMGASRSTRMLSSRSSRPRVSKTCTTNELRSSATSTVVEPGVKEMKWLRTRISSGER